MLAANYGPVADIEIVWILIAAIGLSFSVFNLRDALRDKKALDRLKIFNGRRSIAATQAFQETCRSIIQAIDLGIGIGAAALYNETPRTAPLIPFIVGEAIKWGLIATAFINLGQSVASYRLRKYLLLHKE